MSIAQPSANQIANVYQGNPGLLNARIQQEQKSKPAGLPPDLTKLMALNIDVNEQDAAKRAQAMAALQSMQQQGGGEPPTVADSIMQQAAQKAELMKQQMQQMQPKPQGLMALLQQRAMPQAPENEQRPDRQPSGIDELSSNVGEHFDGGGIVAFDEGGETDKKLKQYTLAQQGADWEARRQAEREAEAERSSRSTSTAGDVARGIASLLQGIAAPISRGYENLTERQKVRQEMEKNRPGFFEDLTPEERTARQEKSRALLSQLSKLVESRNEAPSAPVVATQPSDIRSQLNAADADLRGLPAALKKEAPQVVNQRPPVTDATVVSATPPKPAAPAASASPVATSPYDKILQSAMQDPAAMRDEAIKRMAQAYGEPDTSAQEKYIKQLDESRARFAEPEDFAGRLSRWARNTAGAGGRTSLETGSKGAAATYAEQQANAQRNMDILKELMGESSKVADIKRGYKKELFGFGEKTYDDAFRTGLEAAKEMGLEKRQAQLFAHQSAENALQRANALKVAGMPGAEQREFMSIAQSWLNKPENKGKTLDDAFVFFANAKQGYKPEQARAGLIEKYANDWNKMDYMEKSNLKKEGVSNVDDYVNRMLKLTEQTKAGAITAGAPITKAQYDALPKGASYTAPDGSQRIKG